MKRLLQYCRWLYRYSEGARSALLGNILLGVATVVLNLVFIWMCKSLVDIATKVRPGPIGWYTAAVFVIIGLRLICSALNLRLENITTARSANGSMPTCWAPSGRERNGSTRAIP